MFRQQYSKIGNTREQLFHAWRSFHFDENTETIDAYVHSIRQVANLLGYQDPQVLEVFRNTLLSKLYWVLFPIEDLRVAVDTAKRMLTKEKIYKQLAGQVSSTPFMSIRDSQSKRVSFNTPDDLKQKKDRLTVMMGKVVTEDKGHPKPFKPQVYQSNRGRNQSRGNFCGRFRNNAYRACPSYNQNFRGSNRGNNSNRGNYRYNTRGSQWYRNNYNDYRRNNYRGQGYDRNKSRSLDRQDRSRRRDRSISNGRSRSGSRASTNRDRIDCFKCREYDHFARECPTRQEKREIEQIQQMFNLDNEQTSLQTSLMDTDNEDTITPTENRDSLNLWGRSGSTTFLPISQNSGGNNKNNLRHRDCLTPQQTNFIYKKGRIRQFDK